MTDRNVVERMLDAEKLLESAQLLIASARELAPNVATNTLNQARTYLATAQASLHSRAGQAQVKVNELVDGGVERETALELIELGTVAYVH